jgi:transcriptional regulator with XRE-family HTH domain
VEKTPGLGKRIAELRERRGWTQRKLAEEAKITPTFLSEIENGKRNIGSDVLLRIADALHASLDYLASGEEAPRRAQPLVIPPELALAAEEAGWSLGHTADLLKTRSMVAARRARTEGAIKENAVWSKDDWLRFHARLFDDEED